MKNIKQEILKEFEEGYKNNDLIQWGDDCAWLDKDLVKQFISDSIDKLLDSCPVTDEEYKTEPRFFTTKEQQSAYKNGRIDKQREIKKWKESNK